MKKCFIATASIFACFGVNAASLDVPMNLVSSQGVGESVGRIIVSETPYGLLFSPELKKLSAGVHGFHVHENASCDVAEKEGKPGAALAAGGHLDPLQSSKHLGPYADGHLGDLPALYMSSEEMIQSPVLAPRIKTLDEIKGRSLMVHVGGDNHSDDPAPLGGGGARIACGVIK